MRTTQRFFVALLAVAGAAAPVAAATYTTSAGAPDPGPRAGEVILADFNGPLPEGYTASGDYQYGTGTMNFAAAPAGDATRYFFTPSPPNRTGSATINTFDLSSLSFYWGSIDDYNYLDLLGAGGSTLLTVMGKDISVADGNQVSSGTNRRIFFTAGSGEVITGIRLRSSGIAFEIDDLAGTLANAGNPGGTVPEPGVWAMMIAGFGLVGAGARRRRRNSVLA